MASDWREYQEKAAAFFRSAGMNAETDRSLQGTRTTHDIDVVVDISVSGMDVRWIVECKHWNKPVSKLHVLALREIVSDLGADRGIILCEAGFQSGALEASSFTNVRPMSLAELSITAKDSIMLAELSDFQTRGERNRQRYWNLGTEVRRKHGLKNGFSLPVVASGDHIITLILELIGRAQNHRYPINMENLSDISFLNSGILKLPESYDSLEQIHEVVGQLTSQLERKITAAENDT